MSILEIKGITKKFGGLTAVNNLSLSIEKGELRGLIGPNGSGKTTFFNVLTKLYKPTAGEIIFKGEKITNFPMYKVMNRKIGRTFQEIQLFYESTVLENLYIGAQSSVKAGVLSSFIAPRFTIAQEKLMHQKALQALDFVGLNDQKNELACNLPYGHQRLLEIARAMVSEPELLLLDEPAAGMNDQEMINLMDLIKKIKQSGVTIILVEHNMRVVMGVCEKISVLNYGKKIAEGYPHEMQKNEEVIKAYLGTPKRRKQHAVSS